MDYQKLLVAYMAHVKTGEGVTFLEDWDWGKISLRTIGLNDAESDVLLRLAAHVAEEIIARYPGRLTGH
jgi:hypothetical protein